MNCCDTMPLPDMPKRDPWTGCDGKPHPDSFMRFLLKKAEDEEDYEHCAKIKSELERRKRIKEFA